MGKNRVKFIRVFVSRSIRISAISMLQKLLIGMVIEMWKFFRLTDYIFRCDTIK